MEKYDDALLFEFVKYMMETKSGESDWFEVKAGLADFMIPKFPKIFAGLSNSGGGLIYFGYHENEGRFTDINRDQIEQILLPKSRECIPPINIEFHPVSTENLTGLFVGIPATNTPVQTKGTEKYHIRKGGHNSHFDKSHHITDQDYFKNKNFGHIYLEKLELVINDIKPKYYGNLLNNSITGLIDAKNRIIEDIQQNWEINFGRWLSEGYRNFPIRVWYNSWKAPEANTTSKRLQEEISSEITKALSVLNQIKEDNGINCETDQLQNLLRDLSLNKYDQPKNHRRCFSTLINRENIWNFADAKINIKQDEKKYIIYQDSSGRDFQQTISVIDNLDHNKVEEIVTIHVKRGYVKFVKELTNRINASVHRILHCLM